MQFIHSVALRPVDEYYHLTSEGLRLDSTRFDMGGAGLPSTLEEGEKLEVRDGWYIITGFKSLYPAVVYRMGQKVADHRLLWQDHTWPLRIIASPRAPITFEGAWHSRIWWWLHLPR